MKQGMVPHVPGWAKQGLGIHASFLMTVLPIPFN